MDLTWKHKQAIKDAIPLIRQLYEGKSWEEWAHDNDCYEYWDLYKFIEFLAAMSGFSEPETITLSGGVQVTIESKYNYSKCRACDADDIIWSTTSGGKKMPIHYVSGTGWISHFADCPKAKQMRKK